MSRDGLISVLALGPSPVHQLFHGAIHRGRRQPGDLAQQRERGVAVDAREQEALFRGQRLGGEITAGRELGYTVLPLSPEPHAYPPRPHRTPSEDGWTPGSSARSAGKLRARWEMAQPLLKARAPAGHPRPW